MDAPHSGNSRSFVEGLTAGTEMLCVVTHDNSDFRLTANQNLIISNIAPDKRAEIEALLEKYGLKDCYVDRDGDTFGDISRETIAVSDFTCLGDGAAVNATDSEITRGCCCKYSAVFLEPGKAMLSWQVR